MKTITRKWITAPLPLLILWLLGHAAPARAGVYRIGSGDLNVRVEHPFQVVELTTGEFKAAFTVDPSNLSSNATLEAHVPSGPLIPPGRLGEYLQPRLPPEFAFKSRQVETLIYEAGVPSAVFQIVFRGTLSAGDARADVRVQLKCLNDAPAVRCQLHSRIPITDLGLTIPRMLWVKAKNEVAIEGEIFFAPQNVEGANK